MDKMNFVRDGESKLPPGFRFQPTDEEIVFQYLARKVFHYPLPATIIPEINIFSFDPWELPGDSDQDRYYFSNKDQSNCLNVNRTVRATCAGFWKSTGSDKQIICSKKVPIVGIKKTLVFYNGKLPRATRTDWIMHVYSIGAVPGRKNNQGNSLIQIGNWLLCHVFLKKRSRKDEDGYLGRVGDYDSIGEDMSDTDSSSDSSASCCSDSDSSDITEVSSSSIASGETTTPNV